MSPLEDQAGVLDELLARVAGFGPLQRFLDDPSVEEIWINEPGPVRYRLPPVLRPQPLLDGVPERDLAPAAGVLASAPRGFRSGR